MQNAGCRTQAPARGTSAVFRDSFHSHRLLLVFIRASIPGGTSLTTDEGTPSGGETPSAPERTIAGYRHTYPRHDTRPNHVAGLPH